MLIAAQEIIHVHCEPTNTKKAPSLLHEARSQEAEIADRVAAANACCDKCEQLVQKLDLGIRSDLYVELNDDLASALRQTAASVRIKLALVARQLDEASKLADACDEAMTLVAAAEELKDRAEMEGQAKRAERALEQLREIQRYNEVLCRQLYDEHCRALKIFDGLRR